MSGKKQDTEQIIMEQMQEVIQKIRENNINWDYLNEIARRWCMKDYRFPIEEAKSLGVIPSSLILVALLHIEHPLIVTTGNMRYSLLKCKAIIIKTQALEEDIEVPVILSTMANVENI